MRNAVTSKLSALLLTVAVSLPVSAAEYEIDLSHAFIQWRIKHLGYSVMVGRFNQFGGTFTWDKDKPETAAINVVVETDSIDSNWAERDKHLRNEDFLDVEKFPKAEFKSTRYTGDAKGGKLEGMLTLHGVTKPVVMNVKAVGEGPDPWGGYRAGFEATLTFKRADFGMTYDLGPASESMDLDLYIEGKRK